jgi:hypothetical protein
MSSKEWISFQKSEARMEKIEKLFSNEFYWVDVDGNEIYDINHMKRDMYYEVNKK